MQARRAHIAYRPKTRTTQTRQSSGSAAAPYVRKIGGHETRHVWIEIRSRANDPDIAELWLPLASEGAQHRPPHLRGRKRNIDALHQRGARSGHDGVPPRRGREI